MTTGIRSRSGRPLKGSTLVVLQTLKRRPDVTPEEVGRLAGISPQAARAAANRHGLRFGTSNLKDRRTPRVGLTKHNFQWLELEAAEHDVSPLLMLDALITDARMEDEGED